MTTGKSCADALTAIELSNVNEVIASGKGFWRTCSGCHESEDGHPIGEYPYSDILQCDLGAGCAECGGIGAVWDSTDYEDMAAFLERSEEADEQTLAATANKPATNVPRAYPDELTEALHHVLGFPNFRCAPYAHLMRDAGTDIESRAEAEQAHVLHWLVKLVLDHGERWADIAEEELHVMRDKAKAARTGDAS